MITEDTVDCSSNSFPFIFYDENGATVSGTPNGDGLCIFPGAECGPDTVVHDCCRKNGKVYDMASGSDYMFLAFIVIAFPFVFRRYLSKPEAESPASREYLKARMIPSWVNKIPLRLAQRLFPLGLYVYVTLQIIVPIYMRHSIQVQLSVGNRNALLAAEAFLVPFKNIFQFIEDVVLIRVNYALGRGNKVLTNHLVHVGIVSSIITGAVAAVIGTLLGLVPQSLRAFTNPGAAHDKILYPGCDLMEFDTATVKSYWMTEMWSIPGAELGMVLSGFMMGEVLCVFSFRVSVTSWWYLGR